MFEKERIAKLERTIRELRIENKELKDTVNNLQDQIDSNQKLVIAANNYKEEHVRALSIMKEAKEHYDNALLELVEEKKRYKNDFDNLIKKMK